MHQSTVNALEGNNVSVNPKDPFGNVHIVLFGDPLQHPPPKGYPLCAGASGKTYGGNFKYADVAKQPDMDAPVSGLFGLKAPRAHGLYCCLHGVGLSFCLFVVCLFVCFLFVCWEVCVGRRMLDSGVWESLGWVRLK